MRMTRRFSVRIFLNRSIHITQGTHEYGHSMDTDTDTDTQGHSYGYGYGHSRGYGRGHTHTHSHPQHAHKHTLHEMGRGRNTPKSVYANRWLHRHAERTKKIPRTASSNTTATFRLAFFDHAMSCTCTANSSIHSMHCEQLTIQLAVQTGAHYGSSEAVPNLC